MQNSTYNPQNVSEFEKSKLALNIKGIHASFTQSALTDVDLKMIDDVLLTGGSVITKDSNNGDYITLQVVDKDNIMGFGLGVVLNEFVSNWYICTDVEKQIDLNIEYPAKIISGLYLRLKYNSTGSVSGTVSSNYLLHKILI